MTCSNVSSGFLAFAVGGLLLAGVAEVAGGQCEANEFVKITAFDGEAGDHYGNSVAICGDLAVVGSRLDDDMGGDAGSVYVYRLDCEDGTWVPEGSKLFASDPIPDGWFGISVACEGDRIVVGAGASLPTPTGSAHVFRYDPVTQEWKQEGDPLIAPDAAGGDAFGNSVSISGDYVVVGAPGHEDDSAPVDSGAAYVFLRNDNTTPNDPTDDFWEEQCELLDSAPISGGQFGIAVSVNGDLIAIGADQDGDGGSHSGSVSVFHAGSCDPIDKLTLDGASEDHFGHSVALGTDGVLVAGASQPNGTGPGLASIFTDSNGDGIWTAFGPLTASDGVTGDQFGRSVSISEEVIAVGAPHAVGGNRIGAAYAFWKPPGGWTNMTEAAKLAASDAAVGDTFGISVAVSGSMTIIGAPDDNGIGSAYVFNGLSDCNGNEFLDICDIAVGSSVDEDANGTPDECECEGDGNGVPDDLDGDGVPNEDDVCPCTPAPGGVDTQGRPLGDFDGDCDVDLDDYDLFAQNFVNGSDCLNGDANKDGAIDPLDSGFVLARFGTCPSCP